MKPLITDIRGIAKSGAAALAGRGIKTVAQLANASIDRIVEIRGFGMARAVAAVAAAKTMVAVEPADPKPAGEKVFVKEKKKKGKKMAKGKKGKKKDKKKKGKKKKK